MKTAIKFILLTSCIFITHTAFAVRIDKPRNFYEVSEGETISGKLKIENNEPYDVELKVYAEDFVYVSPFDGTKEFYPPYSIENSMAEHFDYNPKQLTIKPGESEYVYYTISSAKKISKVTSSVLFFESALGNMKAPSGEDVQAKSRIGSLFFLTPKRAKEGYKFENFKALENSISSNFKNTGETFISFSVKYFVMDAEGNVLDRNQLEDFYSLPGNEFEIKIPVNNIKNNIEATLMATFYMNNEDAIVKEVDFVKQNENINITAVRE